MNGGMRDWTRDWRFALLLVAAEGVEATGRTLAKAWRRASRAGRLSQELRRLELAGLLEQRGAGPVDSRLYRVSKLGQRALWGPSDPPSRWARRWDGTWRMALFDVPQSEVALRVRLRRKLRELHFGWLQNSVWLSPDPVSELVQALAGARAEVESLLFMEGRPAGGESDADLVAGAWDLERLAKAHAAYLRVANLRPGSGRARRRWSEWEAWLDAEGRAWREVVRQDPFLPEVLWPRGYAGREVWSARREALRSAGRTLAVILAED